MCGWNYLSIPKLQGCNRWSLGKDMSRHHILYWACDYLYMLGLQLIHVDKGGYRTKTNIASYRKCVWWSNFSLVTDGGMLSFRAVFCDIQHLSMLNDKNFCISYCAHYLVRDSQTWSLIGVLITGSISIQKCPCFFVFFLFFVSVVVFVKSWPIVITLSGDTKINHTLY